MEQETHFYPCKVGSWSPHGNVNLTYPPPQRDYQAPTPKAAPAPRPAPTPKAAPYPPNAQQSADKEREALMRNRDLCRQLEKEGIWPISSSELTTLGWLDPLAVFYQEVVDDIRGEASVGDYGGSRRQLHSNACGRSSAARSLLQLEEHAFYVVVIKLTATAALLEPEKLSPAKRKQVTVLLQHAPQSLRDYIQNFRVVEPTLSSEEQAEKVLSYCHQICDLNIPIFAQYAPKAPVVFDYPPEG